MMKKLWKCIFATALAMMSLLPSAQLKPIEVKAAATFTASNLSGTAYAELNTTTGELVFKRTAAEEAVPESTSTVLVYTGFESVSYTSYSKVPWYSKRTSIKTVSMEGDIQPVSMANWFYNCTNLVSADFSRMDTSNVTSLSSTFYGCSKLTSLDGLSNWDMSKVTSLYSTFRGCSSLTSLDDISGWDTSNVTSLSYTFYGWSKLTSLDDISGWDTSNVTSLSYTFQGCSKLTSIDDISCWDTSNVTDLSYTFIGCSGLTSLDGISGWDTSKVTNLEGTFRGCSSLTSLDGISAWDTSKVANLSYTFHSCTGLTSLDSISGWDTSNVTNLKGTFYNCSGLTSLDDISGWDTSKVTELFSTFNGCSKLASLDGISNWDISNVTSLYYTFDNCSGLASLDGISAWDTSKVTKLSYTFYNCSGLISLDGISGWDTSKVTSLYYTFGDCSGLTSLDGISGWNTSKVTDLQSTFRGCTRLTSLNGLSNWDTSKVTSLYETFYGCSGLTSLDGISSWNMSKVASLSSTFQSCAGLTSLDGISGWDTSKVTNLSSTFYGCTGLTSLDGLSSWDTSKVTSLNNTFNNCSGLTSLDGLSSWDTSNVTNMGYAFSNCRKLISSDTLSAWNTSKVTNLYQTFYNCTNLTSLDLSGWNISKTANMSYMFSACTSLRELTLSSTFSFKSKSLPEHSSTSEYTAYWVKDDALEGPAYTSAQLQGLSGADLAGTWVWQPVQTKYYIEFDGNGASGSMARVLANVGEEYVLPECAYYQLYQEFAGWSLDKEGTELMEAGSSQILSDAGQTTVTLYAQWKAVEYDAELEEGWYTFTLKGDEQAIFSELPTEGSYSIYEAADEGWVLVESENASGSILPNETSNATFTNRQTEDASAQLIASKMVDGDTPDAAFTFELIDENGSVVSSVSNAEDGTILFPVQTYSAEGEYNYTIREVNDHQDGYEYDNSTFAVTVTVTKNEDGNLVSSVSYDQTPVFNNERIAQYGSLTVSKTVVKGDADQEFTFQLNLYDEDGRVYTGTSKGTAYLGDSMETISSGYTFTLKDGESILFTLPYGLRYEVTETNVPAGYSSSSTGASGTIVRGETSAASFTNTYSNPYSDNPASVIVQASKVLEGADLTDGEFAFELTGNGETYTASNSLDGLVSFELTFDEAGTYEYTLKEAPGDSDDIEYDDSEYGVTVTVSESGSRLIASVSYDSTPVFTNVMKPGNLSITVIAQDVPDSLKEEEFSFVLHLTDENGNALSGEYAVQGTDKTVCDGDTIALKNGEVLILENIPAGTQYSFGQTDLNDGWTLSESQNSNGSIVSNQTAEAKFVFVYAPESTTLTFEASKILMEEGEEKDLTAGQFTFELLDEEGNVLSSAVNDESGNIVFDEIVYTAADVGSTFVYQVLEMDDRQEYITYDSTVYTRTVIVSAESGKVTYAIKETDSIVFENTYAYTASGSVKLSGHKTLEGAELQAGQFEFEVLENGSVVSTGLNTASGDISFDTIVYGVSDVGEHTYTVREVKNVLDLFTEYDDSSYSVSVAVSDNGDGTLTCYVSGDDDLSFENVHRGLTVPFAGEIGIGFGLGFGVVLLVGSAYLIWKKD